MAGFFQVILDRIFGSPDTEDQLPDDGGLGEFAKQYAKQLEQEAKFGKTPSVSADDVLHVQQGKRGARAYLLDTTDFRKAIAKELQLSVAPVTEGILKSRCGEKGAGYMHIEALYAFKIRRENPVEEYNAAIDIIDQIGQRLLGDRYKTGEKRIDVPVASVLPEDVFDLDAGTFNVKKAKKAIKWIRETRTHGPAEINWEKGEVQASEGSGEWKENTVTKLEKKPADWQPQVIAFPQKENRQWQTQQNQQKAPLQGDWEKFHNQPVQSPRSRQLTSEQRPEKQATTAQAWFPSPDKPTQESAAADKKTGNFREKDMGLQVIDPVQLRQLGTINISFRPTWRSRDEIIDCYAAHVYRKADDDLLSGMAIYSENMDEQALHRIDKAISKQVIQHLEQTQDLDKKTIIVPLHLNTLLMEGKRSALTGLRALDEAKRQRVWIEILGLNSNTSPKTVQIAIQQNRDFFAKLGIRFYMGDISRAVIERSTADFISSDLSDYGLQKHVLDKELPTLCHLAQPFQKDICIWGVNSKQELAACIKEKVSLINGNGLAKEMRKPGKIIPVNARRLLGG